MALKLSMICGEYDRNRALIVGSVKPEGIELAIELDSDHPHRQQQILSGRFDIGEFFTGEYIADLPYRRLPFTAIPIFVNRIFRHSFIYVNKGAGIRTPTDLHGKRVWTPNWFTTLAIWIRGILEDDHGVDLKSITWVSGGPVGLADWQPPAWLRLERAPADVAPRELLASGAVEAAMHQDAWAPDVDPNIDFLFPNYPELERDYYRRTRCFPIMHTLVVKTAVLEAHPWVALSLFEAWQASKRRCYKWLEWQRLYQTSLWFRRLWEEERAAAGPDPYAWGLSKARHELEQLLAYSYRQGIIPRPFEPEAMFHPSTLGT